MELLSSSIIQRLYHDGLLNQSVAVLAHVLQDLVGSIVAGGGGGLGGHRERVDQGLEGNTCRCKVAARASVVNRRRCERTYLGVVPPDVREQLVDEASHQGSRGVDPSDELRDHLHGRTHNGIQISVTRLYPYFVPFFALSKLLCVVKTLLYL